MKSLFVTTLAVFASALISNGEWKDALKEGLPGKISLRIVDDDGSPIEDASASMLFRVLRRKGILLKNKTDGSGLVVFEEKSNTECVIDVEKEGFYPSRNVVHSFTPRPDGHFRENLQKAAERGWWDPWNIEKQITLKRKGPIVEAEKVECVLPIPEQGQYYYFDIISKSLTRPFGTGLNSNLAFRISSSIPANHEDCENDAWARLDVVCCNKEDGFIIADDDKMSEYPFLTIAPSDGYTNTLEFSWARVAGKYTQNLFDRATQHIVYKIHVHNDIANKPIFGVVFNLYFRVQENKKSFVEIFYFLPKQEQGQNIEFKFR